ncbi:dynein light intermediate chain [Fomitopsis serialis]|uniref:dynein light intermediate chain n=1 Tax=Fomitopsis serialis TaxID=139415 RepID=UPI0020087D0C|nr:dynein light intermediate chain [Neoantrodia serialis]KAH9938017.1 dynein light intermediate chain [Neoantrodia serialis]
MDGSRPSSPDAPIQDLWSSILDSVSQSRSLPTKQVLVLGQPSTGKSTLVSALLKKPPVDADKGDHRSDLQWAKGDGARELEIVREENHERLQAYLQHYTEPSADTIPATSSMSGTVLPLGPGTLTHNSAGVPIIVACTKADLIDENNDVLGPGTSGMGGMVKGKGGEWEERTDSIMQVLRTICLKYGAGLFYTTPLPDTLQVLRQYALHLLFMPPAPSPTMAGSEAPAPVRNPFPFPHKPNPLDRDRIVVPAGWDSWGKIGVLRDGFDAKTWGEAWERDLDRDEGETEPGAKKTYATLVPDQGAKPPPLPPFNNPTPEQAFLAKNYDENSKKPDRDPRGAFRNPTDNVAAGIVGPMGSSSFNLPNVERALTEMEGVAGGGSSSLGTNTGPDAGRKLSSRTSGRPPPSTLAVPLSASNSRSTAPPTGGQTQHEVLQNFFQSLLSNKDRASGAAVTGRTTSPNSKTNGNASGTDEGT